MRRTICWILIVGLVISFGMLGCARYVKKEKEEEEEKEIKIGAILPLTGDAAKYGESAKRGIDLAVDEINSAGGIKGRKIRIIYEDSQADPKIGVSRIEKLIKVEKVTVIIGAGRSSVTLAIAPIAERNQVVLFSPLSSSPLITKAGDYIFRNVASDLFEGAPMARFVKEELQVNKVAILYSNADFGIGLKDSFGKRFQDIGGTIVASEAFEQGATDFRTQFSKIKRVNPEAIYLVGYKEMGRALKQAAKMGIKIQFFSFTMFEDPEVLETAGKGAEGVYYSFRGYDYQAVEETGKRFVNNYKSRYKSEPDIFAVQSYDAVKILAVAIEKGGFAGEGIKNSLYGIKDFPGVTGKTSFDGNGDVITSMSIKMVKEGKFVWYKKIYPF